MMARLPDSLLPKRTARTAAPAVSWRDQAWRMGSWGVLVLAILICLLGVWALVKTIQQAPAATMHIEGQVSSVERQLLLDKLQPLVKSGYFTADLAQIRDAALQQSWVDRVRVSRYWPNGIVVRVFPRHAIARWGSGRLLSDRGDVFIEAQPKPHTQLPLLHGPLSQSHAMMQQYQQINQWFMPVGMRLNELHLTERMTWFMQFDNGLRVIVDQEQTHAKLKRLSNLAQHDLKMAWPHVSAVDLRYRNGLALQWRSGRPPLIQNGQFVVASIPATPELLTSRRASQKDWNTP